MVLMVARGFFETDAVEADEVDGLFEGITEGANEGVGGKASDSEGGEDITSGEGA